MIKMFIFDYGRTLFDREKGHFFKDASDVLNQLSKEYRLAIVSYSKPTEVQKRIDALLKHGIHDLFEEIIFSDTPEGKNGAYKKLSVSKNITGSEIAIVDDYVIRGVAWGNNNGAITYWFRNGKFSNQLPNVRTGTPTYTISCLSEILHTLE